MSDIFKVIFELEGKATGLKEEMDKVKSKYIESNSELRKQEQLMDALHIREKQLLAARSNASSVNTMAKLNVELAKVRTQIVASSNAIQQMNKAERELSVTTNKLSKDLDHAFNGTRIKSLENNLRNANSQLRDTGGLSSKLGGLLAGIGIAAIGKQVIETTSTFDKFAAVLENTLGSKSLAAKALDQIKDFAATTPFSVEELTGSFVKLANQGFVPTQKEMRKLGDIAASQGKSFDQLTEAIIDGQTGEFERLKEFGIRASKEGDKVKFTFKGVQTQTAFTNDAIRAYILSLGDAKGVSGSMAAISETLGGQISNLGDAWDNFLNTVGQNTKPILMGAIQLLATLVKGASEAVDALGAIARGKGGERIERNVISAFLAQDTGAKGQDELIAAMEASKGAAERLQKAGFDLDDTYSKAARHMVTEFHKFDTTFQDLATSISSTTTKAQTDNIFKQFASEAENLKQASKEGKITTNDYTVKVRLLGDAFNLAKDNQALYNKSGKQSAEISKKKQDEYAKELEALRKLREELIKAQSDNRLVSIEDSLSGIDAVAAKYVELQTQQDHQFEQRQIDIKKEFKIKSLQIQALGILSQIQGEKDIKLNRERTKAILTEEAKIKDEKLEAAKAAAEQSLEIELDEGVKTELEVAAAKVEITEQYYDSKIALLEKSIAAEQKAGLNTSEKEKELFALRIKGAADVSKAQDTFAKKLKDHAIAELDESKRHTLEMLDLQRSARLKFFEVEEQRRADDLKKELEFEEKKLKILRDSHEATDLELRKQQNTNEELKKRAEKAQKAADTAKIKGIVDGILATVAATFAASNSIIQDAVNNKDKLLGLQQQRVDEAKNIADKGNAELLELEQDRLAKLTKEKEKFVRAQQSLAAIELVANAGVAIAKAAAEGGVAAPFTIATTIIALIAGLAQARAIASQAAFYEGGYTGDGNPRDESRAVGQRGYTYHKAEFVMPHELTRKNRNIFEDIHKGKIDLQEWSKKVRAYDDFRSMNLSGNVMLPPQIIQNNVEINQLRSQMNELIQIVKHQGMEFNIDESGFSGLLRGIELKKDYVRNKAAKL